MKGLVAVAITSLVVAVSAPASALTGPMPGSQFKNIGSENVERVVVVRRGGYVARGPRGGVVAGRTTVVRPGVRPGYRPGYRPGGVAWARPSWYRWGPGGAIAAGAAIGFVAAGAAVAYGTPPVPGYCWYYTDPSRTQGFWDACPE
jgi:hypothetical protein